MIPGFEAVVEERIKKAELPSNQILSTARGHRPCSPILANEYQSRLVKKIS